MSRDISRANGCESYNISFSSHARPLKGDANIRIPVIRVGPPQELKVCLRNLSDGGPPCRGGKAGYEYARTAYTLTTKTPPENLHRPDCLTTKTPPSMSQGGRPGK
jgi:hypothetical protein